jgi:hypothetical protein
LNEGNRGRALQEVDAALAIDPNFTAAAALRERISVGPETPPLVRTAPSVAVAAAETPLRRPIEFPQPARSAPPRPLVSTEGYARFEERARRRRIERRAEAARAAIAGGHLREAKSAIDEIRALDPNATEIAALAAVMHASRRASAGERRGWHVGPHLAAVAVFATVILAAPWVERPPGLLSHPISFITALVSTAQPAPLTASQAEPPSADASATVADSTDDVPVSLPVVEMRPRPSTVKLTEFSPTVATVPPATMIPRSVSAPPPPSLPAPANVAASLPPPSAVPGPPPVSAAPLPAAATPAVMEARLDEDGQVRKALLQYKSAYEALDARSARAVWPVVNERALARAFDGLESQHLMFDACDIQVNGEAAAATCRGTARYVAKIGSREPRTEPRVWNFTLKKSGQDWKIESARAER